MQNYVLIALLAVAALYVSAAVIDPAVGKTADVEPVELAEFERAVGPNRNLNTGSIGARDRLLHSNYYSKGPAGNSIQTQDITYRGNSSTRITAIRVNEVGYTQNATARVQSGGLNRNTVTIRLTSARGRGWYFLLQIYGR